MGRFRRTPLKKLHGPSAYPDRGSPFSTHPSGPRPIGLCPAHRRYRTQGLATLSAVSRASTLEGFFGLQRSWAFPFRAFLPPDDRSSVSAASSAPALFHETRTEPRTGAPAAFSRPVSRVPFCALGCYARSGPFALLGFSGLSGSLSAEPARKHFPFELPSRPLILPALQPELTGTSGVALPAASRLPP